MAVGVHIDSHEIHVSSLENRFGRTGKAVFVETPLISTPTGDDESTEPVLSGLAQTAAKVEFKSKSVVVALSDTESVLRYFEMALIPKKEWKTAVVYEAHKYLPFDTKDLYYDFKAVADRKDKKIRVMFVAARKGAVDYLVDFFHKSGASQVAVEPYSVSLARLLCPKKSAPGHVLMIIDIDKHGDMNVVMAKNDFVYNSYSYSSLLPEDKSVGIDGFFQAALGAVRLSYNYFFKTHKNFKISDIVFCADAQYKDFQEALRREFGASVAISGPAASLAGIPNRSSGALAASGAALKSHPLLEKFNLNLTPKALVYPTIDMNPSQEKKVLQKYAISSLVFSGVIVVLLLLLSARQLWTEQKKLSAFKKMNAVSAGEDISRLQELAQKSALKLEFVKNFSNNRIYLTEKLSKIVELTPSSIRLTLLDLGSADQDSVSQKMVLRLEGLVLSADSAQDLSFLNQYVRTLNENKDFMKGLREVRLTAVQKAKQGQSDYTRFSLQAVSGGQF